MSALAALAALAAAVYLWAALRRPWPRVRTAAFLAGAGAAAGLSLAPHEPLAAHVAEHALLAVVAAPLIVLGAPLALAARTLGPVGRRRLRAVTTGPGGRALLAPAVTWGLFVSVHWALHVPALDRAPGSPVAHLGLHAAFLVTGVLFFLPVIGRNPVPVRLGGGGRSAYLLLAVPATDLAALWLMARGQSAAGVAMLAGMLPLAGIAVWGTWRALGDEEERERRREARERVAAGTVS